VAIHAGALEKRFRFRAVPGNSAFHWWIRTVPFGQKGRKGDHDQGENGKFDFHVQTFLVANYHK
jgi:hypothetical protein